VATTRIISVDGGGVRGVVPTVVLQRLSDDPRLSGWLDRADLFAGTSTGGLIALALGAGIDLATIRLLYEENAKRVFRDSILDDILDLGKILGADYEVANLRAELDRVFGDRKLAQQPRRVLVTAFDLDN
jgi:patatin-like phospholipase/acyl hydrolase